MATMTLNLEESDINEAIDLWARTKGYDVRGKAALRHEPGDRPSDVATFTASLPVGPLIPAAPAPSLAP